MQLISVNVLNGPNYWSTYRQKLIAAKIDIQELEDFPTDLIDGFAERLEQMLPSLYSHRCSEETEGGFFYRVRKGTWMGHVIEHIALEIQTLAGMDCGYGRTRNAGERGVYNVIFSYEFEEAGRYAAEASIRIADALVNNKAYDVSGNIEALKDIKRRRQFGPSTQSIVDAAVSRRIPYKRIGNGSFVIFGQGVNQKRIRATMTGETSSMGVDIAGDKDETKEILNRLNVPVPTGKLADDWQEVQEAIEELGTPVVIKPLDGNHGRGVTTNITNIQHALHAYGEASKISDTVIVERFIQGNDYRFLVIDYKLVAVAKRSPARVIGNGIDTVQQLIDKVNEDPLRGDGHENVLTKITVDEITSNILKNKGLSLTSILEAGELLLLKDTANLSTGGTARDVTDHVHPFNVQMAERIARIVGLDICGIDIIATDVNEPITKENGAIIEVNACPGFRMHLQPSKGLARDAGKAVVDMLYPEGKESRIPIVAVTGTNGKTTTTRLIAHIAKTAGHHVGFTTTDGIYINQQLVEHGDCAGPRSAETILLDPTVDFAVLECARGGILKKGLGFDGCDISIVTNISEDHLGLKGINTLEDMADVKAVVPRSTFDNGYTILNADDDLVYRMRKDIVCNIGLFSIYANNERVIDHCAKGGLAVIVENGYVTLCKGKWKTRIEKVRNIPMTLGGTAECMVKNVLPAVLAGAVRKFSSEDIKRALNTFLPTPEFMPGRLNSYRFPRYTVMVDYAHNNDGYKELLNILKNTDTPQKIGIVAGIGDRRDQDIMDVGRFAAQAFDKVIIRHDKDLRGRTKENIEQLVIAGMKEVKPTIEYEVIDDEREALLHAMILVETGGYIVVCTDMVYETSTFLQTELQHVVTMAPIDRKILLKAS